MKHKEESDDELAKYIKSRCWTSTGAVRKWYTRFGKRFNVG